MDHSTPTGPTVTGGRGFTSLPVIETDARLQLDTLERNCKDTGIPLLPLGDERRGIVHVIGPELGLTRPGMTIVCGDSHTSTHGAFGALAFGIGTSQVAQVLATQCLLQNKPKTMQIRVDGQLEAGVTAKDLALALCQRLGTGGATGHVIEYTGSGIRALSMEERMTVCNMSIEMGARAGLIAPDETTFEFLRSRVRVSASTTWSKEMATWRELPSDEGAVYDALVTLDASTVAPMITYGTNPGMAMPITQTVPNLETIGERSRRDETQRALQYMGIEAGATLLGTRVEVVFIGSCTNSRLSDLRAAADVLRNRRVAPWVRMLVVPGSQAVKRAAESEGLDQIFANAGAEWRESGCSMCIAMNGDRLEAGQLAVSTSNRNFEGRQGAGGRTILASPVTAAVAAVTGVITDPRALDGVVA
jgi:3-isopropylmalate/(R)-2-methylmalate dehydratase large subunit